MSQLMKTQYLLAIVFVLAGTRMLAQIPESPTFLGIEPVWQTTIVDPSADPLDTSAYYFGPSSMRNFRSYGDRILGAAGLVIDDVDFDGHTLIELDAATGEIVDHYPANYRSEPFDVRYGNVSFRDNEIQLLGYYSSQPDSLIFGLVYIGRPVAKVIDLDMEDHYYLSGDERGDIRGIGFRGRILETSDGHYQSIQGNVLDGARIMIRDYDADMQLAHGPDTIFYDAPAVADGLVIDYFFKRLSQDRFAAYFFFKDGPFNPLDCSVDFYDYDPDLKWQLDRKLDLTEVTRNGFPGREASTFRWSSTDSLSFITQLGLIQPGFSLWFTWFTHEGEALSHDIDVTYQGHYYQLLEHIDMNDERAYVFAWPSYTGQEGFDILKITPDGSIDLVGGLFIEQEDVRFASFPYGELVGDEVLMTTQIRQELPGDAQYNRILQMIKFRAADLGIEAEPVSIDRAPTPAAQRLAISPNPAVDRIVVTSPSDNMRYSIYDMSLKELAQGYLSGGEQSLPVSDYPAGRYVIQGYDMDTGLRYSGQFFIVR